MSEQLRESVSALMDGEADELEVRRVLAADNAGQVRDTWSRFQSQRESMRGNSDHQRFAHLDISQRVSAAIADEPSLATSSGASSWLKGVGGFAVAASVTFAVVLSVQGINPSAGGYGELAAGPRVDRSVASPSQSSRVYAAGNAASTVSYSDLGAGPVASKNTFSSARATSQVVADLEAQKRLERYMLRHTERAALNNGQGMIPYARIAPSESR